MGLLQQRASVAKTVPSKLRTISNWSAAPIGVQFIYGNLNDSAPSWSFATGGATMSVRKAASYPFDTFMRRGAQAIIVHDFTSVDVEAYWDSFSANWFEGPMMKTRVGLCHSWLGGVTAGGYVCAEFATDNNLTVGNKSFFEKRYKLFGDSSDSRTNGVSTRINTNPTDTIPTQLAIRLKVVAGRGYRMYMSTNGSVPTNEVSAGFFNVFKQDINATAESAPIGSAIHIYLGANADTAANLTCRLTNFVVNSMS